MAKILRRYQNGNYTVTIFEDGTKIRFTEEDEFKPEFAENCDVKITDKCDGGCKFCYENSTVVGKHAKLFNVSFTGNNTLQIEPAQNWLKELHPGTELAINGNDLTHPALNAFCPWLLIYLQQKGVIVNLTVNQRHFMKNYGLIRHWIEKKYIRGIGISLENASDDLFIKRVQETPNAVIHTIVGILSLSDVFKLRGKDLRILILGFKPLGRGISYEEEMGEKLIGKRNLLKAMLPKMKDWYKVLSFDNLALQQLDVKNVLFKDRQDDWDTFYMGNDGQFTFYIDAVEQKYALNSCVPKEERKDINGMNIDEMFHSLKD